MSGVPWLDLKGQYASIRDEVRAAMDLRIPVLKYAELLGRLMAEKSWLAVSGTHGKTTTTAMISLVLKEAGLGATFVIGGE